VSRLRAIDDAVYRAEKAVVAAMLALMGAVVFLDVVHRVGTRTGSLLASPIVVGVAASALGVLAFRTRGDGHALAKGVALGVGLTAARGLFLVALPNGLVWSQTLALSLTLWLGTIGASLAAHDRRHLAMDVGSKLWPASWAGKVAAVGHAATAAFCVLVLWLGVRSVSAHWELWVATEGAAGNLSGLPIPKWFPAMAVVYGMGMLAFRFGVDAVRAWNGQIQDVGDETLHQLGISAPTEPT
jgi:TRAP-type C4-dicarboxylate transport system permease small subunit